MQVSVIRQSQLWSWCYCEWYKTTQKYHEQFALNTSVCFKVSDQILPQMSPRYAVSGNFCFKTKTYGYIQGRPSRGFRGGTCTPAFLPSPGNSYIRKKKLYMLFIFPEIPRLMHPCYLGRMGAHVYIEQVHRFYGPSLSTLDSHSMSQHIPSSFQQHILT